MNKICVRCLFLIVLYSGSSAGWHDHRLKAKSEAIEVDSVGQPIVKVVLFDNEGRAIPKVCRFIVDTGSAITILDKSISDKYFRSNGGVVTVRDSGGYCSKYKRIFVKRIAVAGVVRDEVAAVCMDIVGGVGRFQDDPVDGVLGMSYLANSVFLLDIKSKRICFGEYNKGKTYSIPVFYSDIKIPQFELECFGLKYKCIVDTGANGGISIPFGAGLFGAGEAASCMGYLGITSKIKRTRVECVRLGEALWRDVEVESCPEGGPGLVGLDVWAAGPVCFDFVSDRITVCIKENGELPVLRQPELEVPIGWDRSGVAPCLRFLDIRVGDRLATAGFRVGDRIVRAGSLVGATLTRQNVKNLLFSHKPCVWVVERDGAQIKIQIT